MKNLYKISLLIGTAIFTSCISNNQDKSQDSKIVRKADLDKLNSQFYLGSHLAREPMPSMEELKKDMETLKKKGFNLIKLQESWAIDEPLEGQYNFSKYEELIAHAKSLDMYVYLGLTMEQAPAWLFEKYPDCRMEGRSGRTIMHEAQAPIPADGKPGPCFDHPGAMEAHLKFIEKLIETLGKYDNVLVWNTWQEVGYWSENMVGERVCYCDNTMRAFRDWLKEKYGSLEHLNNEWNTNYLDWKYVKPNRDHKRRMSLVQDVYWTYFMDNVKITDVLQKRAEVIRKTDDLNRPVFCHLGSWEYGSGKDWNWARAQDFLGSSSYPASNWGEFDDWDDINNGVYITSKKHEQLKNEIWRMLTLRFDYLRSCNTPGSPIWSAEFQGGPVSTGFHKGRVPSKEDMRRWMLTSIGTGVNAISFWVTRAEIMIHETNGFSLLDSDGDTTPRFEEASRVGKALIKHQDIFAKPSWGGSDVAIFVNEGNYQITNNMLNGGKNLEFSTRGWHRLFWEANIPVDFIEASVLDETDLLKYKAIVMPFPISISDELVEKLSTYVELGGHLISEAAIANYSENSYSNRGEISEAAKKLFGSKPSSFTMVKEPNGGHRWSPWERTWGEFLEPTSLMGKNSLEGVETMANVYIQTFENIDSRPCLYYEDEIAGTVRSHGKGKAWLLGTFIGHNGTAYRNDDTPEFVKKLMGNCDVLPVHSGEFLVRKRKIEGKEALIITNPTEHKITESLQVGDWNTATDLFDVPIAIQNRNIDLTLDSLEVAIVILQ
ncbi:beta-galactosidase [Flagellimonas pacifica]|uniref:beta-galactosidase n=1 Tax=Flagellimonas pacifica TaxID=1247520 RepID=A0A285MX58_9FLAO|nr:beta-galactosidase [Allomuricauda parva]SNZ01762.1 Beta-galactosidase GanA [Allomuricauda parva]